MNQTSNLWSERHHHDPMVSAPEEDDFSSFLEFGLDFSTFDGNAHDGQRLAEDGVTEMDTSMEHADVSNEIKEMQHGQGFQGGHQHPQAQMEGYHTPGTIPMDPSMQEQLMRQHHQLQQQRQHQDAQRQNMRRVPIIPPTPNSMELHGAAERYYQHIDSNGQIMYERHQRPKEDQVSQAIGVTGPRC